MKKLFLFLKLSFQNYSLLRIFQIIEICNIKLEGKTIEFGANRLKKKTFHFILMKK